MSEAIAASETPRSDIHADRILIRQGDVLHFVVAHRFLT